MYKLLHIVPSRGHWNANRRPCFPDRGRWQQQIKDKYPSYEPLRSNSASPAHSHHSYELNLFIHTDFELLYRRIFKESINLLYWNINSVLLFYDSYFTSCNQIVKFCSFNAYCFHEPDGRDVRPLVTNGNKRCFQKQTGYCLLYERAYNANSLYILSLYSGVISAMHHIFFNQGLHSFFLALTGSFPG